MKNTASLLHRPLASCLLLTLLLTLSGCREEGPDALDDNLELHGKLWAVDGGWIPVSPDTEMRLLCGETGVADGSARADIDSDGNFVFESVPRALERCQVAMCRAPQQLEPLPAAPRPLSRQRVSIELDEPRRHPPSLSENLYDKRIWLRMRGINGFAPFEFMTTVSLYASGGGSLQSSLIDPGQRNIHTEERELTAAEIAEIRDLVPQARLFDGTFVGTDQRGSDGYFQVLDVAAGVHATSIIVSGNRSFENGARGQLADIFRRLRQQSSTPPES